MRITSLVAACALVGAGCSDSTAPDASTMSFTYTGAGASTATNFSVTGDVAPNTVGSGGFGTTAWATGSVEPSSNYTVIGGVNPRSSTTWDIASVGVTRKTVGTTQIDPACDFDSTTDCTGVIVAFNLNPNGDSFQYICALTTGSVTITAISATNVAGSFTGSGTCFNALGTETPFTVSNGAFNVAVTTELLGGPARASRYLVRLPRR